MNAKGRYWLVPLLLTVLVGLASGQPEPTAEPPLLFRREYLPKSLLTRQKERLTPVKRKEFDQWLEKAQSRASQNLPEAWIESTELRAVWQGSALVGQARLNVRRRKAPMTEAQPAMLSLGGLGLPILRPQWEGDAEPATVGMTADGELLAVVARSGVLKFDWQLPGRRDPFKAELFDLTLPEASRNSIEVVLPRGAQLESSTGIVQQLSSEDEAAATWSVQLGSAREARLRCVPSSSQVEGPLALVREENICTVSPGELEAHCQVRLDIYREPIALMEVELLGDWSPTSIRQGDDQIPFEVSGDGRLVVLRFDPPLGGTNRRLTFAGRGAVQEGQRISTPRVRIKNAAWLDGTLIVSANGVLLKDWELHGLERPAVAPMPGSTRSWNLQNDDARGAFVVDALPPGLRAETGSTVRLDAETATTSIVADFTAEAAGAFELVADVGPGWVIDSLETVPPQALDDWELAPRGSRQHLRIELQRSISPNHQVQVVIEAHRPAPAPEENLAGDHLRPLRWLAESKGYLALAINAPWHVDFHGIEGAKRVDPAQLTSAERDRLAIAEDVLLLANDDAFDSAQLEVAAETPRFTATWASRVSHDGDRFRQQTEMQVQPTVTPLDRLHILVRPPAGKSLQWKLPDDDNALEARLVRSSDHPAGEDEWELSLTRARRNPFTVQASLDEKVGGRYAARLFRCVEAESQPATIALARQSHGRLMAEAATGLRRLWNDGDVAQWSYDPAQPASLSVRLATPQEVRQLLFVQAAVLETRLAERRLIHSIEYTILNQQAQPFVLRMPTDSELDQVLVQGRQVDTQRSAAGQQLSIPLPESSEPLSVQVVFRQPEAPQGALVTLEAAWPECSQPAAALTWRAVFPDRYRQLKLSSPTSWTWTDLWQRLRGPLPGFASQSFAQSPGAPLACRQVTFSSNSGLPASLRLIDGDALGGLGWLLFALCWAAVALSHAWRAQQLAWLMGGLGLIALSLPASLDPLGRMALLGCIAGLLSRQLRREAPPTPTTRAQQRRLLAPATALLVLVAIATVVSAQDRKPAEMIHRVLFPVDEAGKSADDYVYTSETFYKELYRRAHLPAASGPAALLLSGEYRARPRSDANGWDTIEATVTAEVLQAGPVRIPWPREGFVLPSERIRLDGRTTPITWNADGTAFSVNVATAGRHTVEFTAQPLGVDDAGRCELKLPPAASGRLLLDTLDDAAQLQAMPGPLPVAVTGEDGVQTIELGQRRGVTLITRPMDAAPIEVEAEQLIWTSLWQGGGIIEGRWRFQATSGLLTEAIVDVGGELELLSAAALTPAAMQWLPDEDKRRMIWTPRVPSEELVVEAVFLWRGSEAERVLPHIEPRNAEVTRRWLAVDTRGGLGLSLAPSPEEDIIDVADFAALWNAEDWPSTAYRVPQPGPVLLGTSPVASIVSYDAVTTCEIAAKAIRFEFRAEIKDLATPATQIQLDMPAGAKIVSANVGIAGQFRTTTWLPLAGNQIALLPSEPLRSGNVLVVRGELPASWDEQSFSIPSVSGGQALSHAVELTRSHDVRLAHLSHEGLQLSEQASSSSTAIPVAQLVLERQESGPPQLKWKAEPNHPRTVGILVTTLRREGEQWVARLDAFLAVRDGVVDTFQLDTSANWTSPRIVTGDASLQIEDLSGGLRRMSIRPRGAPASRYHFAGEGNLSAARVQAPAFRLRDAENVQQYVRLPRGGSYTWSTPGMQESELPTAVELPGGEELAVYRAAVPQFQVELNADRDVAPSPRVAWGDVHLTKREDGSYVAVASLAIDPSQVAALPITLPTGALLVQAAVEGEAAIAELKGQRRFEIPLRSSTLPQIVRIVYAGEQLAGGEQTLVPQVEPWKLNQPLKVVLNNEAMPIHPTEHFVSLLAPVMSESRQTREDRSVWARQWLMRLEVALAQADEDASAPVEELRDQLEALLGSNQTFEEPPLILADAPEFDDEAPAGSSLSLGWLAALLGWSAIVVGGYRVSHSPPLQELARRWPAAAAVVVGIAVAILLSPWIGGVLMLFAALASLTWPWQRAARR